MDVHLIVVDLTKHEKGFSVQRCETAVRTSLTREFGNSVPFFFYATPWVAQYLSSPQQTQLARGVPEVIKALTERIIRIGRERGNSAPRILVASYNFYVRRDARQVGRQHGVAVGTLQLADYANGSYPRNAEIEWSDIDGTNVSQPPDERRYYSEPTDNRYPPPARPVNVSPPPAEPRRYYSEPTDNRSVPAARPANVNHPQTEPRRYYTETADNRDTSAMPENVTLPQAESRRYYSEPADGRDTSAVPENVAPPQPDPQRHYSEPADNRYPPALPVNVNPADRLQEAVPTVAAKSETIEPEKYPRSREMRTSVQKAKLFNEKPIRDLLFKTVKGIVGREQHLQLSALRRILADESFTESQFSDKVKWDGQVYFFCRLLLFSGTFVDARGDALSHGASADGTEVHDIRTTLEDDAEAYLIEYIIRDLGNVTEFEHTPLAHAVLRQFDTALEMGKLKDRVAFLISKVSERLTLDESGVYVHRVAKPSLRAVK